MRGHTVLVCGSVAIDIVGTYAGRFDEYEEKFGLHALNVSLQLSRISQGFGGCGINITYGLKQLGIDVVPVSAAGANFNERYRSHLENLGIDTRFIKVDLSFENCATAIILTDSVGNQLTAFQAGASVSKLRPLPSEIDVIGEIGFAIIAPDDAPVMLRQARDLHDLKIPIMFDPGQGLAEFLKADATELIGLASFVVVNSNEWQVLQTVTELSSDAICEQVTCVIVTSGERGVDVLLPDGSVMTTASVPCTTFVDPTGCGDAFRAGFMAGLMENSSLQVCSQMGVLLATYNLESDGTQQYQISRQEFDARLRRHFSS